MQMEEQTRTEERDVPLDQRGQIVHALCRDGHDSSVVMVVVVGVSCADGGWLVSDVLQLPALAVTSAPPRD